MKILVIDDELELLGAIENILQKNGHEVDSASGVKEAKSKISDISYDLVICDIMLPHWGGFDVVDAIKENPLKQNIPVIVITGMDREILDSTLTYADVCLSKPFTGKELLDAVNSLAPVK